MKTIWLARKRRRSFIDLTALSLLLSLGFSPGYLAASVAPPAIPHDYHEPLRKAFMNTMQDREFRAEAVRASGLEVKPVSGRELEDLARRIMDLPPTVVERLQRLLSSQGEQGNTQ